MLINKTDTVVKVKYNSKFIDVEPGEKLDVRDFDVANKDIIGAEKHIMSKLPGSLEITKDKKDGIVSKEMQNELKALKDLVNDKDKQLKELREGYDNLEQNHSAAAGEVSMARKEAENARKEVTRYKKENDDLEDEVKKLRLQLAKGKK